MLGISASARPNARPYVIGPPFSETTFSPIAIFPGDAPKRPTKRPRYRIQMIAVSKRDDAISGITTAGSKSQLAGLPGGGLTGDKTPTGMLAIQTIMKSINF